MTTMISVYLPALLGIIGICIAIRAFSRSRNMAFLIMAASIRAYAGDPGEQFRINGVDVFDPLGRDISISFQSESNGIYDLQYSPDLELAAWSNVNYGIVATSGLACAVHPGGGRANLGFYRIAHNGHLGEPGAGPISYPGDLRFPTYVTTTTTTSTTTTTTSTTTTTTTTSTLCCVCPSDVGYYDMLVGSGVTRQVAPIQIAGHTPLHLSDLGPEDLESLNVILVQNPSNSGYGTEYTNRLSDISDAVAGGSVLVVHDRYVTQAATILPGGTSIVFERFLNANIDIENNTTFVTEGPGGIVGNDTLDGGSWSHHGYAYAGSLPPGTVVILSDVSPTNAVTFAYPYGSGWVVYSSIPLDHYLFPSPTPAAFREIYAPNVVAYAATVDACADTAFKDFGDAPSPYPTLFAEDGARHWDAGPALGANRDAETNGLRSAAADGDDTTGTDDEDGVTFGSTIQVGQLGASVTVFVTNAPIGAQLDAWIDFNADGSWGGPFEQITSTSAVTNGNNAISFDVPSWAVDGTSVARFRLSTSGSLGPEGASGSGEVEDHLATLNSPTPGNGTFSTPKVISAASFVMSVFAADMDGDGDMDVISPLPSEYTIAWYENDGSQNFSTNAITTADFVTSVFAADVDGDGDMDLLAAAEFDDTIAWYENDGTQNFSTNVITAAANGASAVFAADVDGDGDMDVLSSSTDDGKIAWYENDGSQNFSTNVISTSANNARSISAADVDGDGDMDVISATFGLDKFAWYENDGSQNFSTNVISADPASGFSVADLDGDGDMDVVSASQIFTDPKKVAWYENDGNQNFSAHIISSAADLVRSIFAADVDGDGDMDVLAAYRVNGIDHFIAWYENDGSQNFSINVITTAVNDPSSVFAADVDGDGDMDVLSASNTDQTIGWFAQANIATTTTTSTSTTSSTTTTTTTTITTSTTTSTTTFTTSSTSSTTLVPPVIVNIDPDVTLWAIYTPTGIITPQYSTNLLTVPIEWLSIPIFTNTPISGTNLIEFEPPDTNTSLIYFRLLRTFE